MGKERWFHALSCVVRPERNEKKNTKKTRQMRGLFWRRKSQEIDLSDEAEIAPVPVNPAPPSPKPGGELIYPEIEEASDGLTEIEAENEDAKNADSAAKDDQQGHDHSIVLASAYAEATEATEEAGVVSEVEPAEATAEDEAEAEVVRLTTATVSPVKSKEEAAVLKIQSVFRGYKGRRSFRAVKGMMRLKSLVKRQPVKRQATTTLNCMQAMARVQHQVRARRIRMSEENHAFQRQLQQKHDLEKFKENMGEEWDDSKISKEEAEAKKQMQLQAAIKRERTLAYAYTHQQTWRNSLRQETQTSMDPYNLQWSWNWVEKWMATRPWENKNIEDSEPPSAKSLTTLAKKVRRDLNLDHYKSSSLQKKQTHSRGRLSVLTPGTTTPRSASASRVRVPNSSRRSLSNIDDDDAKSMKSVQMGRHRRQASCPIAHSFMSPTSSSKERSRSSMEKIGIPEAPVGSAKKLSFTGTHALRRHSDPQNTQEVH
ncbi:hypothetical protein Leryth_018041 [Lithospermum erythrorhizon]|nr:hypothetical protein Leryth_018041 [Lithospermum erythrorhizon]